jgi:hypothetical protein
MAKRKTKARVEPLQPQESAGTGPRSWLEAIYHFHVFHYRMPQTAAIAALNPFVPSPLTVKFAMVASLLQMGRDSDAKSLATILPSVEVLIVPPKSAFAFKAFLRYRSVPAVESQKALDESGSYYPSRPHTRDYSLCEGDLIINVGVPEDKKSLSQEALKNVRYLGCKDSLVWCRDVRSVQQPRIGETVQAIQQGQAGAVILLADFDAKASFELKDIIPGQRDERHYLKIPCTLPGNIGTVGRTKIFKKHIVR